MTTNYLPPVDRLLRLGAEPARRRRWPDYLTLGLEERHAPALIRMATDPALHDAAERGAASWAPVHAWRALAQLGASSAAEPLLALLEREGENEWVYAEIPAVLGMLGPAALPGATLLLFDEERPEALRIAVSVAIANVAHEYPERRDEVTALLSTQLQDWAHQGRLLNSTLIDELVALGETAAAPVMEAVFAVNAADPAVCGDWQDVQVALGLLAERTSPPAYADPFEHRAGSARPAADAEAKARSRRKAEKQARKRNRKKR